MACIISCCIMDNCSLREGKVIHKQYVAKVISSIKGKSKDIKGIKEEGGFYVIEFMDNLSDEKISQLINVLDKEASMSGIYLKWSNKLLKLKVPTMVDISNLEKFIEKLDELVWKTQN